MRKFNLLQLGISYAEQKGMTDKERKTWEFIGECLQRRKKLEAMRTEAAMKMRR